MVLVLKRDSNPVVPVGPQVLAQHIATLSSPLAAQQLGAGEEVRGVSSRGNAEAVETQHSQLPVTECAVCVDIKASAHDDQALCFAPQHAQPPPTHVHTHISDGLPALDEFAPVAPLTVLTVRQRNTLRVPVVVMGVVWLVCVRGVWSEAIECQVRVRLCAAVIHSCSSCVPPLPPPAWRQAYLLFQASSAICTFCRAVSSVNGGSGGLTAAALSPAQWCKDVSVPMHDTAVNLSAEGSSRRPILWAL